MAQNAFTMSSIAENLEYVREQIAQAAMKSGRSPDEVELVAITKTHPAEKVRDAIEAGQSLFGESRGMMDSFGAHDRRQPADADCSPGYS